MTHRHTLLRTVLSLALTVFMLGAFAQTGKTKVVLYKDRLAAQFDTVKCVKNVVKMNPLLFFRGEIPIYYERALSPRLSLEVGIGVTLRDYLALSFNSNDADDFGAGTKIIPELSFHIGGRYYLVDDLEPQGTYFQADFSHLQYTKDISMKAPNGALTDSTLRDQRIYNDFRVYFGYQMLSSNSNWMFDLYTGLGIRDQFNTVVHETVNLSTDPNSYTYTVTEDTELVPVIFLGVKIGMGF
jgi:hypothetical protein